MNIFWFSIFPLEQDLERAPSNIAARLPACVSASVLDISREKISEPASIVNGLIFSHQKSGLCSWHQHFMLLYNTNGKW